MQYLFDQPIIEYIWKLKYRHQDESCPADTHLREMRSVYSQDSDYDTTRILSLMNDFGWVSGGRITAGAGTDNRVTLINCFVNQRVEDSMEGIMESLTVAALTQQQGGGIGTGFSSIRPAGALVKRTGSISSGILPFMDMWNAMCATVKSSGSRRGAMMATLACWHPDLPAFIVAKQEEKRLTNFNISVLATDEFISAVINDQDWDLGFHVPPADASRIVEVYPVGHPGNFTATRWWKEMFAGYEPGPWYVYKRVRASDLWDSIIRNTYEWAEPGIIFIDRVNEWNNLSYCEFIDCTNPCGEQPLPNNGDCDLGHVNLATCVTDAFTIHARVDWQRICYIVREGVRFLDNVMDVTLFPTLDQKAEAQAKRRIGLGHLGLGNLFQMMMIRYGSPESVRLTEQIMMLIRDEAYMASVMLAKERGPFPAFDRDRFLASKFVQTLPEAIRKGIYDHGIRNGVLLTVAPTGTKAVYVGNVSAGCEPSFGWVSYRKILKDERDELARDQFSEYLVEDYGFRTYLKTCVPEARWDEIRSRVMKEEAGVLPAYMVTAFDLSVSDHLVIQEMCQRYVDASISKTVNCPREMPFADFREVYMQAYQMGLKGITTYRPSGVRGAVLSRKKQINTDELMNRPDSLPAVNYKRRWTSPNGDSSAYYISISDIVDQDGVRRPFEIFISSMNVSHFEWVVAFTRTVSSIFRRNKDIRFLIDELKQVHSPVGGMFLNGKYVHSLVAMIAGVIEEHIDGYTGTVTKTVSPSGAGDICSHCLAPTLFFLEGCNKCLTCGFSSCG